MSKSALVVIDVQIDFLPGGALPVPTGDEVVPVLREYIRRFKAAGLPIIATRDWHPKKTKHFKEYGGQWPPHCVQGTKGAEFAPGLELPDDVVVTSAGVDPETEGYTSFEGHDEQGRPFEQALRDRDIDHLYVGGLATDYCVRWTVLDALARGFEVTLLVDAIRGIDLKRGDAKRAIAEMVTAGAQTATLKTVNIEKAAASHA